MDEIYICLTTLEDATRVEADFVVAPPTQGNSSQQGQQADEPRHGGGGGSKLAKVWTGTQCLSTLWALHPGLWDGYIPTGRISRGFFKTRVVLIAMMLVISPAFLSSQLQQINSFLSLTEIHEMPEGLNEMKSYRSNGRVLAQKVLGTGDPLSLALLPHYSKKPGILTYSRGYHDSLSLYYLELLLHSLDTTPWFPDLLRLYNIRFLATYGIEVPLHFLKACQLRHLAFIGSMEVYVREPKENYGYFEFVHVPGAILGDLKGMREAVVRITQLFTNRAVFAVNPSSPLNDPPFEIVVFDRVADGNFLKFLSSEAPRFENKWFVSKMRVKEKAFREDVKFQHFPESVRSRVLQEEVGKTFYRAYVHVHERAWSKNFYETEHLLLKVTYHPYWKCAFHSSAETIDGARDWHEVLVHHVTPSLMSIVLPPGKHHVICQYKNPICQKVGFVLFLVSFIALMVREIVVFLHYLPR
ncbi:hypothetical protein AWC38_SpisGene17414 [Stylophora pistillata]|uniref:Transmembrane protein n=1 Tax=Stylophora pistillata TaxID=50429 RepID=A0A2B4RPQ2_STYPI|nr:hypothetical protein AWC38_SpisGene17414 [Stylophora pistillata]